jgi:hypothetical protein
MRCGGERAELAEVAGVMGKRLEIGSAPEQQLLLYGLVAWFMLQITILEMCTGMQKRRRCRIYATTLAQYPSPQAYLTTSLIHQIRQTTLSIVTITTRLCDLHKST